MKTRIFNPMSAVQVLLEKAAREGKLTETLTAMQEMMELFNNNKEVSK